MLGAIGTKILSDIFYRLAFDHRVHFEVHAAQRPNIGRFVSLLPFSYFRCGVTGIVEASAGSRWAGVITPVMANYRLAVFPVYLRETYQSYLIPKSVKRI